MDSVTLRLLPKEDIVRLQNSAKIAQGLEDEWARKIARALHAFTPELLKKLEETGRATVPDLESLFVEHFFETSIKSVRYAVSETEAERYLAPKTGRDQLARYPAVKIPKSLESLMKLYDQWRKGKYKPKRQIAEARKIQKEYLKSVASVWEEHSKDFRKGVIAAQDAVVQKIKKIAETTVHRASTIVRTETTNYYNKARKDYYDSSQDITHYLFIAIRDAATSPWCTPLTVNGFRGRSGLVYSKDDPLLAKERPACHPNCRSEIVPLNRLNPAHLRLIQDWKLQRRNHKCYPLLPNWKAA
jgi:SPP1 gp7 family putative phage head morphogenesis protein